MTRSKLAATAAVLTLTLAACANGEDDTTTDDTTQEQPETGAVDETTGNLTGTISDAEVADDGSVTLDVETDEGAEQLTTSTAAYITTSGESGGQQRTRLTTWLQNNEFDGSTEYELIRRDDVVTDIRG
jgi:hypothetical protein